MTHPPYRSPPLPPTRPRRRAYRVTLVVALVVVAPTTMCVRTGSSSPRRIELRVLGTGSNVMGTPDRITASYGVTMPDNRVEVSAPWSTSFAAPRGALVVFYLTAFSGAATCELRVDGALVSRASGSGPITSARCDALVP